jgi:hypothetical protein
MTYCYTTYTLMWLCCARVYCPGGDLGSLQSGTELVLGPENPDRLGPQVVAGDATPQLHVVAKVGGFPRGC